MSPHSGKTSFPLTTQKKVNCIPKEAYWFSRGGNTQKMPSIKHFHMQNKAVHLNNDISSKRKKSLLEFYLKTNFLSLGKTYDAICWRMVGWPIAESADSLTISWWCDVLLYRHSLERYVTHVRTGWRIPIQWLSHPGKHLKPTLCYAPARCSLLLLLQLFIAIHGKGVDWMPSSLGFEEFPRRETMYRSQRDLIVTGWIHQCSERGAFFRAAHSHHKPVNAFCQIFPRRIASPDFQRVGWSSVEQNRWMYGDWSFQPTS